MPQDPKEEHDSSTLIVKSVGGSELRHSQTNKSPDVVRDATHSRPSIEVERNSLAMSSDKYDEIWEVLKELFRYVDWTQKGEIQAACFWEALERCKLFGNVPPGIDILEDLKSAMTLVKDSGKEENPSRSLSSRSLSSRSSRGSKYSTTQTKSRMQSEASLMTRDQFETTVNMALLSWGMDVGEFVVLRDGFKRLDEIRDAFIKCDLDGSGEVEADELRSIMAHMGQMMNDDEVADLLTEFDHDGDGTISWQEFLSTMCKRDRMGVNSALSVESLMGVPTFMMACGRRIGQPANTSSMNPLEKYGMQFLQWRHNLDERVAKLQQGVTASLTTFSEGISSPALPPSPSRRRGSQIRPSARNSLNRGPSVLQPSHGGNHVLTDESRARIRRIEIKSIFFAIFAGVLSAGAAGIVEVLVANRQEEGSNDIAKTSLLEKVGMTQEALLYVAPVVLVFSILEICIMYSSGLSSALDITTETGLKLFPVDDDRAFIAAALARSALQVGNPKKMAYGVDPVQHVSKGRIFVGAAVYMGKKGLTTIFLKLMLKRVFVRAAAKSVLSFVAVPVNGLWNAFVMMLVMREIRVCSIGPSFIYSALTDLTRGYDTSNHKTPALCSITYRTRAQMIRAIGICIVNKKELHPNLETMLRLLRSMVMDKVGLNSWTGFRLCVVVPKCSTRVRVVE
jgi:hypothetical protein